MLYNYKAKNEQGKIQQGEIEAENPQSAYAIIRKKGFYIVFMGKPEKQKISLFGFFEKITLKDLAIFSKELQVMVKAGLSLSSALRAQAEQTENKKLAEITSKLASTVEGGTSLSKALAKYPNVFSPVYINTVASGESSGKLEEVLTSLAKQLEKDHALYSKIKGAMIYPAFILVALFAVIIIVFVYVIPSLASLFSELGSALPFSTRMLIGVSNLIIKTWWVWIIFIIGLIIGIRYYQKTSGGRHFFDVLKIKFPLFGKLIKKIYIARFCRTSSTLIKAGLPILGVLKNANAVISNSVYQTGLQKAEKRVESGVPLAVALKESSLFPKMVSNLISVGEQSGHIEESLDTLADYFEQEVANTADSLASLIEPVLIVIMGLGVGLVVISVIKPIYTLAQLI